MQRKKRFQNNRSKRHPSRGAHAPPPLAPPPERAPTPQYGKPFTLLEDEGKATFEFTKGSWVPYSMTIAECREHGCQVKELPQKVNRMTRYEVRCPVRG
jgi:hypothetical protein